MHLPRAVRTAAFRLTALYALIFVLSLSLILGVLIASTQQAMLDQIRAAARDDAILLARTYAQGGPSAAATLASSRGARSRYFVRRRDGVVLLQDFSPGGAPVGPFSLDPKTSSGREHDDADEVLLGYGTYLPSGIYVAAARDNEPATDTTEAVLTSSVLAGALALTLALAGGFLVSMIYLRRIDALERTASAIMVGDLSRRMPTRGTGDEFDRLSANLNRMLDRIQILMDGLRQVSTDVAHDLRTPLSRLRQRLEAFAATDLAPAQKSALDGAISEADTILSIFAALLQIAQVESGALRARFTSVDLGELAAQVGEIYQPLSESVGHALQVMVEPSRLVRGSRELLLQLIVNLVENAITHTPHGAKVTIGVQQKAGAVILEVSDDGIGIPAEERGRVFGRFYRLDVSRSTPGTGLGLSLVAAIAAVHEARVEVCDNQPGLRMVLTFPRAASQGSDSSSTDIQSG